MISAIRKRGTVMPRKETAESVLSIQLYARLLARYPASTFASRARAAVEMQKKNLTKA